MIFQARVETGPRVRMKLYRAALGAGLRLGGVFRAQKAMRGVAIIARPGRGGVAIGPARFEREFEDGVAGVELKSPASNCGNSGG